MPKHICMLAYTNYATDARVRRAAETLASLDSYEVSVLALKEGAEPQSYRLQGVCVEELNISKYRGKSGFKYILSYLNFTIRAFFRLNIILPGNCLDIVHVHNMPNFLVLAAVLPKLFGRKIILDIHDTMVETYLAKFDSGGSRIILKILRLEERLSCALADELICVNHIQCQALTARNIPREKITVVINAPDPRIFQHGKEKPSPGDKSNKFKLIYHGTIAKRLGIDLTIKAVSMLASKIPQIEFCIFGNGDDKAEFIECCKHECMNDHVFFRDMVPLEQLAGILEQMDLGVISNRKNIATELMLPVKMLECIAVDIPVVVPRLKAIEHYFSEDMVYYFQPDDVDSLANAILEAFEERAKRREKAANARIFLQEYGWDAHKYDLINLYQKLSH
jgi:glycosyltransferase involved in cell wall biosynthesis